MKNLYVSLAALLVCLGANAQTIQVWNGERYSTFNRPDSIVFVHNSGEEYDPQTSVEDESLYSIAPGKTLSAITTDGNLAVNLYNLLLVSDYQNAGSLNNVTITDEQFEEIKEFTTKSVVSGKTTKLDVMKAILAWCKNNIKYPSTSEDWEAMSYSESNDAYNVFTNRMAVCQGYANLCNVMLHTQGIPAVNANGFLENYGGHAWVYPLIDDSWYVIDPTNDGSTTYKASSTTSYKTKLVPWDFDMPFFADDNSTFSFKAKMLNVQSVNNCEGYIYSVPYSARGYVVQSFDPQKELPSNVREIYLHKKIQSIGDYVEGLTAYGKNLYKIYVDNDNTSLCDFDGCVYSVVSKAPGQLLYVPGAKTEVTVAPIATIEKNTICNNESLQKVTFDATSLTFEDYAIENCPNITEIHLSKDATYGENAFYGVSSKCKIITY